MPNLNEEFGGMFVRAGVDVKDGDVIKFVTEGSVSESKFKDKQGRTKKQLNIEIELPSGEVKTVTVNASSRRWLTDEFGADTAKWVDKEVDCHVVKQMVGKEMRNVLYIGYNPEEALELEQSKGIDE